VAAAAAIDLYTFTVRLPSGASALTHSRSNIQTHVYVQVHNRGLNTANNVQVMLLLATGEQTAPESENPLPLPPLPPDYEQFVRTGLPIAAPQWQTLGITTLHGIRSGHPRIAHFTLDADRLPTPGRLRANMRFALVALVHCTADPFVAEATATLTPGNNRHAAHRWITVEPFAGKVPAGTPRRQSQQTPADWLAEHKVRRGETLSQIAKHYYQTPRLWPLIYNANQKLIGANPNFLQIGWVLRIPQPPQS
jgi:hypothetical protein